jgi:GxxExxY protein
MNADEAVLNDLSERIIGCAMIVSNSLGSGFLEKVYENALAHELRKAGLAVAQQCGIVVRYDGIVVGEYAVDLLVEEAVIVELKATKAVADIHRAQCINYLRGTGLHLCLLLNFGNLRMAIKRIVLGL